MRVRTVAPAKINWTLEVLGRREDGYHEIKSVMQTIDLCDGLSGEKSPSSIFETTEGEPLPESDLIVQAARALEERVRRALPTHTRVEKWIPVASGLGGGSSDAAAVLRLLNALYQLGLSVEDLASVGATVGSDVPFFLYGGTALVEGRGEKVTPLRDVEKVWLTVVVPRTAMSEKTRRMYGALTPADYTDGSRTDKVLASVSSGVGVPEEDGLNVFERHAYRLIPGLRELRNDVFMEGLFSVHLVGAGPSIFAYCEDASLAEQLGPHTQALTDDARATRLPKGRLTADTFSVRTLRRRGATLVSDKPAGSPR